MLTLEVSTLSNRGVRSTPGHRRRQGKALWQSAQPHG